MVTLFWRSSLRRIGGLISFSKGGSDSDSDGATSDDIHSLDQERPDPMDPSTYEAILRYFGLYESKDGSSASLDPKYTEAEAKLREDMVNNKAAWCGSWRQDVFYFFRNTNPVLALFYSHPLHPISRLERCFIYFCNFFVINAMTIAVLGTQQCTACNLDQACKSYKGLHGLLPSFGVRTDDLPDITCSYVVHETHYGVAIPNVLSIAPDQRALRVQCCSMHMVGLLQAFDAGGVVAAWVVTSCFNVLHTILFFQLLMCQCSVGKPRWARRVLEWIGRAIVMLLVSWRLPKCIQGIRILAGRGLWWWPFYNYVVVKSISWAGVTLMNTIAFSYLYWKQMRSSRDLNTTNLKGRCCGPTTFHVTVEQYRIYCAEAARYVIAESSDE
eukprot:TRINITY_DN16014_c0_g2_i2.p1 TRINITY_DN16014_c0_g2~~TRINITY_DN16014_c0_g2_i2.p1  ORF type:complete len:385 (+),score=31.82 TRINITY_DN16014_c0_g2_i2:99-1253(+)